MSKLFDPQYLFNISPGTPNLLFWKIILVMAFLIIVIAIVATIKARNVKKDALRHKLWFKLATWGYTVGGVCGILAFFRFQDAYLLSMRVWVVAWIGGAIVWLEFILKYALRDLPRKLKEREEERAFRQYLPHKK